MERRKVSKLEEKNSILETLSWNDLALDYIQNEIYRMDNLHKFDTEDEQIKQSLDVLRYIKFSLEYLDKCYNDRLKKLGVVHYG